MIAVDTILNRFLATASFFQNKIVSSNNEKSIQKAESLIQKAEKGLDYPPISKNSLED